MDTNDLRKSLYKALRRPLTEAKDLSTSSPGSMNQFDTEVYQGDTHDPHSRARMDMVTRLCSIAGCAEYLGRHAGDPGSHPFNSVRSHEILSTVYQELDRHAGHLIQAGHTDDHEIGKHLYNQGKLAYKRYSEPSDSAHDGGWNAREIGDIVDQSKKIPDPDHSVRKPGS